MRQASDERQAGAALAARLRERRTEIEGATLLRVRAVSAMPRAAGPEYAEGLRAAVAAGIAYGIEGIEHGERSFPPPPEALLAQARLAARSGVGLDTVLRRYFAGHTLLEDFMVEEAERLQSFGPSELKRLLRVQAALVDRLLAAVSDAYAAESERRRQGSERRRSELVERLLAGEPLDATELGYDLSAHHLALVASGPGAERALRELAHSLDARLFSVAREGELHWAWLGRREPLDAEDARRLAAQALPPGAALALGEPGEGMAGWRLSHRQARAALAVALRGPEQIVRYADVALLAAVLEDDLLATSLRRLYLEPLEGERDGEALRETLRAYFACEHNVSSTAVALGIDRRTVKNRLRATESYVGRPLSECAAELQMALRMRELEKAGR